MTKSLEFDSTNGDRVTLVDEEQLGMCGTKGCKVTCCTFGAILIALSVAVTILLPNMVDETVKDTAFICDVKDDDFESWQTGFGKPELTTDVTTADGSVTNREFYMFDIQNPKEFLEGSKPVVHEIGPWTFECFTEKFDIAFDEDASTVEWRSFMWCNHNPENPKNCDDCAMDKTISTWSGAYQKVLKAVGSEGQMALAFSGCSATQIGNIPLISAWAAGVLSAGDTSQGKAPCFTTYSATFSGTVDDSDCACCIPDSIGAAGETTGLDTVTFITISTGGGVSGMRPCSVYTDPEAGQVLGLVNALTHFDGGTVMDTGNAVSTGGNVFPLRSPVILTKTVNNFAFGHVHALAGWVVANSVIGGTRAAYQAGAAQLAAANLPPPAATETQAISDQLHTLDVDGYTVGVVARDAYKACKANCQSGAGCIGSAPAAADLDDDVKYMAGMDCAPLTLGIATAAGCARAALLTAAPAAALSVAAASCTCSGNLPFTFEATLKAGVTPIANQPANDYDYTGEGCCIATSEWNVLFGATNPLASAPAQGCMAWVGGSLNSMNVVNKDAVKPEAIAFAVPIRKMNTGCKDESKLADIVTYQNYSSVAIWNTPQNGEGTVPNYNDATNFDLQHEDNGVHTDRGFVMNEVTGKAAGGQILPLGLEKRSFASAAFNDGKTSIRSYSIYVPNFGMAVELTAGDVFSVRDIKVTRFAPSNTLFADTDANNLRGIGIRDALYYGVYSYDVSIILSQPNFCHTTDAGLYTEIDLYKIYNYDTGDALATPLLRDQANVLVDADKFNIQVNVEPSTGKAFLGHTRLQASFYQWACSPLAGGTAGCGLFYKADGRGAAGFASSNANIFTPGLRTGVIVPSYWLDEWGMIGEDDADTFKAGGALLQTVDFVAIAVGVVGILLFVINLVGIFKSA